MKQAIVIFLMFIAFSVQSQSLNENYTISQEFNFFYTDTANGEIAYGKYEPTGLLYANDGSLIVSTEFSISFPNQYKTPANYDSLYFAKQRVYREKSHVSSGCIFKLDNKCQKEWELIFKGKRVETIEFQLDSTIIVVGERVDMKRIWIANINLKGNIIWEKEYKNLSQSTVGNSRVDSNGDIFVLLESERRIPLKIRKIPYGRRRLELFKIDDMNQNLYLMSVSSSGKRNWISALDKRKKYTSFGYNIVFGSDRIYATGSYDGLVKNKGEYENHKGKSLFEISMKGKILNESEFANRYLLFYDNGVISCDGSKGDSILIYRNHNLIKTNLMTGLNQKFWVEATEFTYTNKYIFGTLGNNLGYRFMEFSKDYSLIGLWTNNQDRTCEAVDFVKLPDESIIILGLKWKKIESASVRFINIVKINKNGV